MTRKGLWTLESLTQHMLGLIANAKGFCGDELQWYPGFAGREDSKKGVLMVGVGAGDKLFGNLAALNRWWGLAQQAGYELVDQDSYSVCGHCGRLIETSPSDMCWSPDYWITDGDICCGTCVRNNGFDAMVQTSRKLQEPWDLTEGGVPDGGSADLDRQATLSRLLEDEEYHVEAYGDVMLPWGDPWFGSPTDLWVDLQDPESRILAEERHPGEDPWDVISRRRCARVLPHHEQAYQARITALLARGYGVLTGRTAPDDGHALLWLAYRPTDILPETWEIDRAIRERRTWEGAREEVCLWFSARDNWGVSRHLWIGHGPESRRTDGFYHAKQGRINLWIKIGPESVRTGETLEEALSEAIWHGLHAFGPVTPEA